MSLTQNQIAALREIEKVWPDVKAVIIGATALGFYYDMTWRKTADVDLAVALTLDELPDLVNCAGWQRHPAREHIARLLVSAQHRAIVTGFLGRVQDPESPTHALMRRLGPARWTTEDDALARRLRAFSAGMERPSSG